MRSATKDLKLIINRYINLTELYWRLHIEYIKHTITTYPQSPYWLVRKKRVDEAEKSLKLLFRRDADVAEELKAIRNTTTREQCEVKNQVRWNAAE